MEIPDAIDLAGRHLQKLNGDRPLTRESIVTETLKHGSWSPTSIMPSDFCYNRTNAGARLAKYRVFLMVDPDMHNGLYRYVGRNYAYSGQVIARPQAAPASPVQSLTSPPQPHPNIESNSTIGKLWKSSDEKEWRNALGRYWQHPSVIRNLEVETFMANLDLQEVRKYDRQQWYEFLEKYFTWKFKGNYLPQKLNYLGKNGSEQLTRIKERLFALDELDLADIRSCIDLVRSPQIKGLQYPGASGLLAVLFPNWFGTADRFVVESLRDIESLPERDRVRAMNPKNQKERDAILLIEIMRRKAKQLNNWFSNNEWTPRKVDMILWTAREFRECL